MSGVADRARARLVAVVLLIYLLAIVEGAIRKYVTPQFGQYVFFIRDPFLIYAYVMATRHGLWPRNSALFRASLFMCALGLLLFVMQVAVEGLDATRFLLGFNGWRSYFLYIPLAFLIGETFRAVDLARVAKLTLALAVPIAVLVAVQFASPPNAPVNVGVATEEDLQFKSVGLDMEHIRTTGPFTSSAGLQQFVSTACAIVLALLLLPSSRRSIGLVPLMIAAGAVLTCVALGGSRGTTLQCALNVLFALSIGAIGRGPALRARAVAVPLSLSAAAIALYPIVFPTGFQTFMARWDGAARSETAFQGGVFGRALYGFVDFIRLVDIVPVMGYGLGYGGNASITLRAEVNGVLPGLLAETDFSRHMVDLGPVFGLGFIGFRIAFVIWLTRRVLMSMRRVADPLPMLLLAYAAFVVLLGQITGNGTINVYAWLFAGFCLAATRVALVPMGRQPASPAGVRMIRTSERSGRSQPNRNSIRFPP